MKKIFSSTFLYKATQNQMKMELPQEREYIAKTRVSDIIKSKSVNEESAVAEIRNIGKINIKILEKRIWENSNR